MTNSKTGLDVVVGKHDVKIQHLEEGMKDLKLAYGEASKERKKMTADLAAIQATVTQINQKLSSKTVNATTKIKGLPINSDMMLSLVLLMLSLNWIFGPDKAFQFLSRLLGTG